MSTYLLDTHLLYWWMTADPQLGDKAQRTIAESEIVVSVASLWEMALKNAKGKLPLPNGDILKSLAAQGFSILPILPAHIDAVRTLPTAHSDPFDCLLIAQATVSKLTLLTEGKALLKLGLKNVRAA